MSERAIDVLADFDKQAALDAGFNPNQVNAWEGLHAVYFGPTTSPQKQRLAREKAQRKGFSLDQLALIERRIKKIKSNRTRTKLRLSLLDATGNYKALARLAKRLVPGEDRPPRKQVTFTRSKAGCRTMTVTAGERDMADLEHALMLGADTSKPVAPQMLENFLRLMRGYNPKGTQSEPESTDRDNLGSGESSMADTTDAQTNAPTDARNNAQTDAQTDNRNDAQADARSDARTDDEHGTSDGTAGGHRNGVPYAIPRPLLLLPLPDWIKIHQGEGDETILYLTDGTSMTGAEFLNLYYATAENYLEAAIFHPEEGAVNLYRGRRLANEKQRVLARATSPECPVPDCRHSADACEIHHITAWKNGGETNLANLAPLCRYHNRVNDDDPQQAKRGRIINVAGTPVWRSPRGYVVDKRAHGAMSALFS